MTNAYAAALSAYKDSAVSTASPARVVVLAYERLVLDCERAVECLKSRRPAHEHLLHAQELVLALQVNLDVDMWDGAKRLSSLYTFLYEELVWANINKDATKVVFCLEWIGPLLDAWRQAEIITATQGLSDGSSSVA
jgi:flagellar secretion chaperone FliS